MTFQAAQAKFSAIIGGLAATSSSDEVLQQQRALIALQNSLPAAAEFDVLADAIAECSPKLTGRITQGALSSLQARDASLKAAAGLLTQVTSQANANAQTLAFAEPRLIAAALKQTVTQLQELRAAAQAGDFEQAVAKVDALATLIEHVRGSIQAS